MPLYTYVVTFKGDSYVAQDRRSNFKGFVESWTTGIPKAELPALTPGMRAELSKKAYYGDFLKVPNRKNVWQKTIQLDGGLLTVYAIQTDT